MKLKNITLTTLGVLYIILGITAIVNTLYRGRAYEIFWLCYLGLIFVGMGLVYRNSYLLISQLNLLLFPLLIWDIDFLYYLFTGKELLGITTYFFLRGGENLSKIISLQHLFIIPVAFLGIYLIGFPQKSTWKISFMYATALFIVTRIVTPSTLNVNCVYRNCLPFIFPGVYELWLFGLGLVFIVATDYSIRRIFSHLNVKKIDGDGKRKHKA